MCGAMCARLYAITAATAVTARKASPQHATASVPRFPSSGQIYSSPQTMRMNTMNPMVEV